MGQNMKLNYDKEGVFNKASILLQEISSIITEIYTTNDNFSEKIYFETEDLDMFSKPLCDECIIMAICVNEIHFCISLCLTEESPIFNIESVSLPSEIQRKGYCTKIIQKLWEFIIKNNFKKFLIIADRSEEFVDSSGENQTVWTKIFSKFPELEVAYF